MSHVLHFVLVFVAGAVCGFVAGYLVRRRNPSDPIAVPGVKPAPKAD